MNTRVENLLPDNAYWKYFLKICSIPHPSGHEEKLREFLIHEAGKHNLQYKVDNAGNLAIERPAAPGCEKFPRIILQAHLDMVPQAADGVEFDFLTDSIVPIVEGDWVTTGNRTTLGADDGMGVALIMEALTDKTLQCGALRGVFTVSEETGLGGAEDIDLSFLDGDILFNLDSDVVFTIGCAGGSRFEGRAVLKSEETTGNCAIKLQLKGMQGGHSGVDIHRPVGSAAVEMGKILTMLNNARIASVSAGTLHNAIAREAAAVIVIDEKDQKELEKFCKTFAAELNNKYTPAENSIIELTTEKLTAVPQKVLTSGSRNTLLKVWNALPHGVLEVNADGSTGTSSNLAVVSGTAASEWSFILLVRSLYDKKRIEVTGNAMTLLRENGFTAAVDSQYTSWEPRWDSPLLEHACKVYESVVGKPAERFVIHGGLEPGMFCGMNPKLEMLSFAPATQSVHSPQEKLSISDSENIRKLLRKLLENPAQ
ncbi:MAG: beta-Ala-His dipeptidase [Lentisphaeria bacterium]|nr:beta-Ala-His dipeptidase [Lentisphaeria bacterium]